MIRPLHLLLGALLALPALATPPGESAATAVNAFGLDYLRLASPADNVVFSPASIQFALGMTTVGAAGETLTQMRRTLHYADTDMNVAFAKLRADLTPGTGDTTLDIANRLFAQQKIPFLPAFLETIRTNYRAPVERVDFAKNEAAAKTINSWVEKQTHQRIRDLVPPSALDALTRLVLVNAIYFKAPWADPFPEAATRPRDFRLANGGTVQVPTMTQSARMAVLESQGFTAVALPYAGGTLQFLILLPTKPDGLSALEKSLTVADLAACANAPGEQVTLQLPKFRLEPPARKLNDALIALGMPFAFDQPVGSADFSGMTGSRDLFISDVFHKAFIAVDEKGTEAAAATAAVIALRSMPPAPTTEVRVDRPFLFAIQHRPTGTCLFLGRVTDPR